MLTWTGCWHLIHSPCPDFSSDYSCFIFLHCHAQQSRVSLRWLCPAFREPSLSRTFSPLLGDERFPLDTSALITNLSARSVSGRPGFHHILHAIWRHAARSERGKQTAGLAEPQGARAGDGGVVEAAAVVAGA